MPTIGELLGKKELTPEERGGFDASYLRCKETVKQELRTIRERCRLEDSGFLDCRRDDLDRALFKADKLFRQGKKLEAWDLLREALEKFYKRMSDREAMIDINIQAMREYEARQKEGAIG